MTYRKELGSVLKGSIQPQTGMRKIPWQMWLWHSTPLIKSLNKSVDEWHTIST